MPELKALARERRLRGYSRLRKADLIAFLQNNEQRGQRPPSPPPQMSTWEPEQPELEVRLTKRQLKCRRNKDSKLAKKFKSLDAEIGNLKSQMEELENKITKASESTNAQEEEDQVHEKRG